MSAIRCSRLKKTRAPPSDKWKQWCVAEELDEVQAVNDEGDSAEYVVLCHMGITFREGMRIRHRNHHVLDNRRANLEIILVE